VSPPLAAQSYGSAAKHGSRKDRVVELRWRRDTPTCCLTANSHAGFATTELSEAREQQTATSDVLRAISSSGGELGPVFQAMLENATRLCEAKFGVLWRVDGETFHTAATQGLPPALAKYLERGPHRPGPETGLGRLLKTRACIQVLDALEDRAYAERDPIRAAAVELGRVRTFLVVPMLKVGTIVGAMSIIRQEVRPLM
jgi:GAF domain-containing protein